MSNPDGKEAGASTLGIVTHEQKEGLKNLKGMYRYNRILVGLNLVESEDATVLQYASMICQVAQPEVVHFIHIAETLDLPNELFHEAGRRSLIASYRELLEQRVGAQFKASEGTSIEFQVSEGGPLVEMLHSAKKNDIDLVIVGYRHKAEGGSKLPERLARKAPCSVLVVPEGTEPTMAKVLVATDFSDHSADALNAAIAFGSSRGIDELICLHIYAVPPEHYKIGKTFDEFDAIMRSHAAENYEQFIAGIDLKGLAVRPIFAHKKKPGYGILEIAKQEHADLVVIGAQGRTTSAVMLLGSVAQRVITHTETPVLAVKKKGAESTMRFLEAFLRI